MGAGMRGCQGACMVAGGMHGCQGGMHGCQGDVLGYQGACMVAWGMHGCPWKACMVAMGHAWLLGERAW